MTKKKETMIYWRVGKGEKHEIPTGATVTLVCLNGEHAFYIDESGQLVEHYPRKVKR